MLHKFVSVYVPSTINVNVEASADKIQSIVKSVAAQFAAHFGGSTVTTATGYWVADSGEIVEDKITIVKSYHDIEESAALEFASTIAKFIKVTLSQEAVTVENNEGIDFI